MVHSTPTQGGILCLVRDLSPAFHLSQPDINKLLVTATMHDLIDKNDYILLPELDILKKSMTLVKNVLGQREHNTALSLKEELKELEEHVCNYALCVCT